MKGFPKTIYLHFKFALNIICIWHIVEMFIHYQSDARWCHPKRWLKGLWGVDFPSFFLANQSACFGLNWEGHLVFLGATGWFSMGGIEGLASAGDWNGGRGGFNDRNRRGTQKWWCEAQWLADELVFSGEHWPEKWGSISLANPPREFKGFHLQFRLCLCLLRCWDRVLYLCKAGN